MPPYTPLPRDDDTSSVTATTTAADSSSTSSSSDSSSSSSWLSTHKEQVYIGVAVAAGCLLLLLIVLGRKHRLTFWPFKQKRCSGSNSCGKGIPKNAKVDKDCYSNGSGGWRCRDCQEKFEAVEMEKEMEDTLEDEMELKHASRGREGDGENRSPTRRGRTEQSSPDKGARKEAIGDRKEKRQGADKDLRLSPKRQVNRDVPKPAASRGRQEESDDEYSD